MQSLFFRNRLDRKGEQGPVRRGDLYTIGQIAGCRCFPAHYGVTIVLIRGRLDGLTHGEYLKSARVGEAKNPGPEAHRYRLMITNPTHLYTRLDEVMSCKADTVCLAETAYARSAFGANSPRRASKPSGGTGTGNCSASCAGESKYERWSMWSCSYQQIGVPTVCMAK